MSKPVIFGLVVAGLGLGIFIDWYFCSVPFDMESLAFAVFFLGFMTAGMFIVHKRKGRESNEHR